MRMQKAKQILQALDKLGRKNEPLTRVYRNLFQQELYLMAYQQLYQNRGALTPGTDGETVDGMNLENIDQIIEDLRYERYRFKPSSRIYIDKKNGQKRPISIPSLRDKLVQGAVRLLLEAYYEPRFSRNSHGFRPGRGCHTALSQISKKFIGCAWLIEGDIKGAFDNIDHTKLLDIIQEQIKDGRLLNLIKQMLKAGYMEDWRYHKTYSGVPQGGIISPILSNIYLAKLDQFYEEVLRPKYTLGKRRRVSLDYKKYEYQIRKARQAGDHKRVRALKQERRQYPSRDTHDPHFRRLRYCRYADDFLLGYIGSKQEAEGVKQEIRDFLGDELKLTLNKHKTLVTSARTKHAEFLGYEISIHQVDDKMTTNTQGIKTRSINGGVRLGIPRDRIKEYGLPYRQRGKPIHQKWLTTNSEAEIMHTFQQRYRGIAQYYKYAVNRRELGALKYWMEGSLVKTLATKMKISVSKVYRRYRSTKMVDGYTYKTLEVRVPTEKRMITFHWGGIPLKRVTPGAQPIDDGHYLETWSAKSELVQRLTADQCELCHKQGKCEVHHIKKLADLKKRWAGRKEKPIWVQRMIARQRKTLVVCRECHQKIHHGQPTT